jgi:hypothetical protein
MRFLMHGQLSPAAAEALKRHEHVAHLPAEADLLPESTPGDVLRAAAGKQWDILTADPGLARSPFEEQTPFNRSIVFLQLPAGDVEQDDAIDRLFKRYKRLTPGRIYTVTEGRVKVRQLPTNATRQSRKIPPSP